jgi:predicted ATPase
MNNKQFLVIEGYKCFVENLIPFRQLTVLAGGNSVGKSSVVQSLLLMRSAFENNSTTGKVNLNGEYCFNLGNTGNIASRKGTSITKRVFLSYGKDDETYMEANLGLDFKLPEVFLNIDNLQSVKDFPLSRDNFHYLHAERLGPRQSYKISSNDENVGWQGENTIAVLSSKKATTGELDVVVKNKFIDDENPSILSQVVSWMGFIVPNVTIDVRRINEINQSLVEFNGSTPFNVGFGISYVLPIIVAGLIAKEGEMLIVENPEAHLHPSGQSRIGFFLAQIAGAGVQVVIETHSEHVINGIRLASLKNQIPHNDVIINFFSKDNDSEVEINEIELTALSDLTMWPFGFFDQVQQDIRQIMKSKREMRNEK